MPCLGELPRAPYRVRLTVGGVLVDATVLPRDEGDWLLELDGRAHVLDDEIDLLGLVADGDLVEFERGGVIVALRRTAAGLEARARATVGQTTHESAAHRDVEQALLDVTRRASLARCISCAHSDYEPGTGFGGRHLMCLRASADAYAAVAVSTDRSVRKWGPSKLDFEWVDELDTCASWTSRPPDHGYRG